MHAEQQPLTWPRIVATAFDEDGFVEDPTHWSEELAEELANASDLGPLTLKHWETIRYIRHKYIDENSIPLMRHLCRHIGLGPDAVKGLFGGCRQLWRIAGLPNPGEEAKSYMD
jgi:tRNA 2-thiouridine synthesizing protein E